MLIIQNGLVVDPASHLDEKYDIVIENDKIVEICKNKVIIEGAQVIDASDLIVAPGLVDMHVHFRDPGFTYKEDILSGAMAAAAGGVTTVACMPNTNPVIDSAELIQYVREKGEKAAVHVLPYGAVSLGQKGECLSNFETLQQAGAVALSDDGVPIQSGALLRKAMLQAKTLGMLISSHCEDGEMVKNYAVNEGKISKQLGIPGRPAIAEELMAVRDMMLAEETGAQVHIAHVSTRGTVEAIRQFKARGVMVTAETCPQYFSSTEELVLSQGTLARVNPPLRTEADRLAIIEGLQDGTLDAIVTDHAPHSQEEKNRELTDAPSGMVGLETSLGLTLTQLYHRGKFTISEIVKLMSTNPAKILGIPKGTLAPGNKADIVIFDPNAVWTVDRLAFRSKGKNSPYSGMQLQGKVKYTIVDGAIQYQD